jgi:Fic family protein
MQNLDHEIMQQAELEILIFEAMKNSEIEGEYMSRIDVMSSIRKNLGITDDQRMADRRVAGIAALTTMVRKQSKQQLTSEMILDWHKILMQSFQGINAGYCRKRQEPMQVISGTFGKETIHFQAPPASQIEQEMNQFLEWFNTDLKPETDEITVALVKTAIAHLYYESIHPFEDGNGRIGRALAEFTLSNSLKIPVLLSLSKAIEKNKSQYYSALKLAQSGLEICRWILYFINVILDAQRDARETIEFTVTKSIFLNQYRSLLNERQTKVINRMLQSGPEGFEGGMSAAKYMSISKTSKATATRDLQLLYQSGIFNQLGAGRSVRYELNFPS